MTKAKPTRNADRVGALLKRGAAEAAAREASAAVRLKEPLTIRLSKDVLSAIYYHQADVRTAGGRKRDTTIGAVVESLLRQALRMAAD